MKLALAKILTVVAIVSGLLTLPLSTSGQKRNTKGTSEKILVGFISDSSCGLQHMAGMNDKDCALMCAKNGKFVLADREHKVVYQLDKAGQEKASEFAGQKVKVKGRISGKTIRVTAIEAFG